MADNQPPRSPAPETPTRAERAVTAVGAAASAALLLLAAAALALTLYEIATAGSNTKLWLAALFQLTTAAAAAFAAAILLGKFRDTPAITLFCAGGTGLVAAPLMETDLAFRLLNQPTSPTPTTIASVQLLHAAMAVLAVATLVFAASILTVVLRVPRRTIPRFAVGLALLAAPAAAAALLLRFGLPSTGSLGSGPASAALLAGGAAVALILAVLFVSVAAHLILTAIDIGIDRAEQRTAHRPDEPSNPRPARRPNASA